MAQSAALKKRYSVEFREKAVKLVTELGYTIEQVSEKLGCSPESVRRWKDTLKPKLSPETVVRMEHEEKETKRLRKENAQLKAEIDILKSCRVLCQGSKCKVRLYIPTPKRVADHPAPTYIPGSFEDVIYAQAPRGPKMFVWLKVLRDVYWRPRPVFTKRG